MTGLARKDRRGRPPYDHLAIFFHVAGGVRRSGKDVEAFCNNDWFDICRSTAPLARGRYYDRKPIVRVKGGTLRRRYYDARRGVYGLEVSLPEVENNELQAVIEAEIEDLIALQSKTIEEFSQRPQ